jgi:hypothetical protein
MVRVTVSALGLAFVLGVASPAACGVPTSSKHESTASLLAPPEAWHNVPEIEKMKGQCYLSRDTCVDKCADGKGPGWAYECVALAPYHCCRPRKCDFGLGPARVPHGGFVCIPSPGVSDCCDPEGEEPACASGGNSGVGGCVEWRK